MAEPIHFIGIGGIGMSALAKILLLAGKTVSGSDKQVSEITDELANLGARIFAGHTESNAHAAGTVVVSTAIPETNPEYAYARSQNVPILHRSEVLARLAAGRTMIAVSGTHGKTTTTGMIAQILLDLGQEPNVVVGGVFGRMQSNAHFGSGSVFVFEADESDRTHASVCADLAVITNIEADHLENYAGGIKEIKEIMCRFANNTGSAVIMCADDPGCREILKDIKAKVILYGKKAAGQKARYTYKSLPDYALEVFEDGQSIGEIKLTVPGEHNKLNAMAAMAACREMGLPFQDIAKALSAFSGVDRRFQIIGQSQGVLVVDDYAHHPTEVVATIQAAREYMKLPSAKSLSRLVVLFQPHQPGRLRDLWEEFRQAFKGCDLLLLADVYIARGASIEGINSQRFASVVNHAQAVHVPGSVDILPAQVLKHLKAGDLVLTVGAGDVTKVGAALINLLEGQKNGR